MGKFIFDRICNWFFPIKCGYCGKITENYTYVCTQCKSEKNYEEMEFRCKLCGTKLFTEEKICNKCNSKRIYYNELIYFAEYKDFFKSKMLQYKFYDKKYLKHFFAQELSRYLVNIKVDYITGVPITKKRLKERGYNQTNLIAKELGKILNIVYVPDILVKIKETQHQSQLSKTEREVNVKNVFCLSDTYDVKDKKILLIDDIFTTGSTVNECSKVLKQGQAKSVIVATVLKKNNL